MPSATPAEMAETAGMTATLLPPLNTVPGTLPLSSETGAKLDGEGSSDGEVLTGRAIFEGAESCASIMSEETPFFGAGAVVSAFAAMFGADGIGDGLGVVVTVST